MGQKREVEIDLLDIIQELIESWADFKIEKDEGTLRDKAKKKSGMVSDMCLEIISAVVMNMCLDNFPEERLSTFLEAKGILAPKKASTTFH